MTLALIVGEPMAEVIDDASGIMAGAGLGGDALNVAVYLAREAPALRVALATAIGDDQASADLLALCRAERIDVTHIRTVPGARLGAYRIRVNDGGERSFVYDRSESPYRDALAGEDLLPDPRTVDLLLFSGISVAVARGGGRDVLLGFARRVRDAGGLVAYDLNHRASLWESTDDARVWLDRIAPVAGILLASLDDGRAVLGVDAAVDLAIALRGLGIREAVVTDGPRACAIAAGDRVDEVEPAIPVAVVDTTAAGDAFDAGYLSARLRGQDPSTAAAAGHRAAARVVTHRGAIVPRS